MAKSSTPTAMLNGSLNKKLPEKELGAVNMIIQLMFNLPTIVLLIPLVCPAWNPVKNIKAMNKNLIVSR